MMRPLAFAFQAFDCGLLEGASLLVPTTLRWEWRREWRAEMWHVRQACAKEQEASWRAEREVMAFCLGAFPDAWCLSREARRDSTPPAPLHSSASQCLLCLTVALAISYAFALLLPEVRTARNPLRYSLRSGVILLEGLGPDEGPDPNVSFKQFRVWSAARHRYFDGFAFYKLRHQSVVAGAEAPAAGT